MSELADFRLPGFLRDLVRSLVPVTCPEKHATDEVKDRVVDDAERFVRTLPATFRLGLAAGLTAYDLLSVAVPSHRGKRASRLPDAQARAWYDFWAHGPLGVQRLFAYGVKGVIAGAFYEQPSVREAIGYTPDDWTEKVTRKRLMVYSDDIARHEASVFERDPLPLRNGTVAPSPLQHAEAS